MLRRDGGAPLDARQVSLVARARAGDAQAFEELVRPLWPRAYRLALHFLQDPGLSEDIAQEAFVRAWMRMGQLRAEAAFSGWLLRIVANLARNALARARETPVEQLPGLCTVVLDLESGIAAREQRARLAAALSALRPQERLAVELVLRDELSYREAADILGMPMGSVKTLVHRARAKLRQALAADRPNVEGGVRHVVGDVR